MTDSEFALLVQLARLPEPERLRRSPRELQSSLAVDMLSLLCGDGARGAAAGAWLALVQQEAREAPKRKSTAG